MTTTNEKEIITSTTTSTSTTSTTRSKLHDEMDIIKEAFQDAMNRPMPQSIANYVKSEILLGNMDVSDLCYALAETAMAPRPSWRYTMAIMNRLKRECPLPWMR